uniref:Uncharacterized protein n=1 Tax=Cyprinodon variegatus TaxID=28743 RepID=A0A3Q2DY00_CYPVA
TVNLCFLYYGLAGGTVVLTPAVLTGMGFTAAGIAGGSIAAQLMSIFGSTWLISLLQSIGATGMGWFGNSLWGVFGGFIGNQISFICNITVVYKDTEP